MSLRLVDGFADMAIEAHLAHGGLDEMAFSLYVQSLIAQNEALNVEVLAARIELPIALAQRIIDDKNRHAFMLAKAADLLKSLIPHEAEVRAIATRRPVPLVVVGGGHG